MAVPPGLSSDLAAYVQTLEDRLDLLENPVGYMPAFMTVSTNLTTAGAALSGAKWAILTDLRTAAYSTGAHWIRIDTGATIV